MTQLEQWHPALGEGWIAVLHQPPPPERVVEFCSQWSTAPYFGKFDEFPPWLNTSGLWWRES